MNDLPNVSDLARVIRTCSCGMTSLKRDTFIRVTRIENIVGVCSHCGDGLVGEHVQYEGCGPGECYPRAWLRRVPGLDELESIDICTELDLERRPRVAVPA